eukprot:3101215-Amphidinium_carterae.1
MYRSNPCAITCYTMYTTRDSTPVPVTAFHTWQLAQEELKETRANTQEPLADIASLSSPPKT